MKIRKNIIGFAVAVTLLSLIGPWNVFAWDPYDLTIENHTAGKVTFVINNAKWIDVNSRDYKTVGLPGGIETITFHTYGDEKCPIEVKPIVYGTGTYKEQDYSCPTGDRKFQFRLLKKQDWDNTYSKIEVHQK